MATKTIDQLSAGVSLDDNDTLHVSESNGVDRSAPGSDLKDGSKIRYSGVTSGLSATNAQDAIDELVENGPPGAVSSLYYESTTNVTYTVERFTGDYDNLKDAIEDNLLKRDATITLQITEQAALDDEILIDGYDASHIRITSTAGPIILTSTFHNDAADGRLFMFRCINGGWPPKIEAVLDAGSRQGVGAVLIQGGSKDGFESLSLRPPGRALRVEVGEISSGITLEGVTESYINSRLTISSNSAASLSHVMKAVSCKTSINSSVIVENVDSNGLDIEECYVFDNSEVSLTVPNPVHNNRPVEFNNIYTVVNASNCHIKGFPVNMSQSSFDNNAESIVVDEGSTLTLESNGTTQNIIMTPGITCKMGSKLFLMDDVVVRQETSETYPFGILVDTNSQVFALGDIVTGKNFTQHFVKVSDMSSLSVSGELRSNDVDIFTGNLIIEGFSVATLGVTYDSGSNTAKNVWTPLGIISDN